MPSRRRFLAACGAGIGVTGGCLSAVTRPDIPRERKILQEQTTVEPGSYHGWSISERVREASLSPVDGAYIFSHEFIVEQGPAVTVAVTSPESAERARTGADYKVLAATKARGRQGHASEPLSVDWLEVLGIANPYIGPGTPAPDRSEASVQVKAYLSRPESS